MRKILLALVALFMFCGALLAAVDVNKAGADELSKLKGIGAAKAKAIVEYREKNGAFKSVDDLTKVKGIGAKVLEGIKKDVSVGGATPAATPAPVAPAAKK